MDSSCYVDHIYVKFDEVLEEEVDFKTATIKGVNCRRNYKGLLKMGY